MGYELHQCGPLIAPKLGNALLSVHSSESINSLLRLLLCNVDAVLFDGLLRAKIKLNFIYLFIFLLDPGACS